MELNKNNIIGININVNVELEVKTKSKEFHFLLKALNNNVIVKGFLKKFGYDNSFIVVDYSSSVMMNTNITEFSLRMVEDA